MKTKLVPVLIGVALLLGGCTQSAGPREVAGTGAGAVVGAIIGSQFGGSTGGRIAGALIGAAVGGAIGNRIGAALDEEDRRRLVLITQQTASTGSVRTFTNRRTGVRARTRVVNQSRSATGQACRTVEQEVVLQSGRVETDRVTACQTAQGWVV